ncbi:Concanavalin A-like lectin/glucanase, subgroup [Artemisia annua]|uniref:Concanavalin A-like lectin/glucanase, subgroup n=1 Tax=Artemisia annua TaxID=35608 RepID=A0A2U1M5F6_ARTAN|nr:Concanavalin A-like lectin/glucanase, subgroup [Artemisia annua]
MAVMKVQKEWEVQMLATKYFDESLVIGHGGFGKVYKGNVISGAGLVPAAIKRLDPMSNQGAAEFWTEVEMLSKLRHCNLVSLIGYCNYEKEMILIYEYMPNGTLEDHLHKLGTTLSWVQRLKICISAGRGLHYLHTGTGIERALHKTLDEEQRNLAKWAKKSIREGNVKNIIDSDLRGQISPKCLKEFVRIAERCLQSDPKQRPTMAEVVVSLESITFLQEKINNSSKTSVTTIFGKMADMFAFPSKTETSVNGDSKISSYNNGNSRSDGNAVGSGQNMFLGTGELTTDRSILNLKEFKFSDLEKATSNFSEDLLLGRGSFGRVFLGWFFKNPFTPFSQGAGIAVAVERLDQDNTQGLREWKTEISILGPLGHSNIVSLLGYCRHEHEYLCVYEYMQTGSFDQFINRDAPDTVEPLLWQTRLNILIGVARGLAYLHSLKDQVIHRNVKSSSIFLDHEFNSKLGHFGLAKSGYAMGKSHVSTRVAGTLGYIDPHSWDTGHFSVKSDIYGFGVVMLETLTGLPVIDGNRPHDQHNLVEWASPILVDRRELSEIMDPRLEQNYPEEESGVRQLRAAARCWYVSLVAVVQLKAAANTCKPPLSPPVVSVKVAVTVTWLCGWWRRRGSGLLPTYI